MCHRFCVKRGGIGRDGRRAFTTGTVRHPFLPAAPPDFQEDTVLRDDINTALKESMKAGEKVRLSTLRLVNAAIKDRDIEARGLGKTRSATTTCARFSPRW